jgi:hypothetical protein
VPFPSALYLAAITRSTIDCDLTSTHAVDVHIGRAICTAEEPMLLNIVLLLLLSIQAHARAFHDGDYVSVARKAQFSQVWLRAPPSLPSKNKPVR